MSLKVIHTAIPDVVILEPRVFGDDRGFFFESFNKRAFAELIGQEVDFVQDNHSMSAQGVLRGLHFQKGDAAQGKLVRVVRGAVYDVAVDIRPGSSTFGKWVGEHLTAENKRQLWVPRGFAHGFLVISEEAEFLYKTDNYYRPETEGAIIWNDPDLGIAWPLQGQPSLSSKDAVAPNLRGYVNDVVQ